MTIRAALLRLKVDFALIDQNIANQILWLVSHAPSLVVHGFFYESKFETGCVAGAPKKGTARPTFELAQQRARSSMMNIVFKLLDDEFLIADAALDEVTDRHGQLLLSL